MVVCPLTIDLSIIEDITPAIRVRQSQEESTTLSFPRRRESSGFKQKALLSCWIPACAGMTVTVVASVMNFGKLNKQTYATIRIVTKNHRQVTILR
jgi:hypothetical protein